MTTKRLVLEDRPRARVAERIDQPRRAPAVVPFEWGRLPAISLVAAAGLLLVAIADYLARLGQAYAEWIFWLGILTLVAPITLRVVGARAGRGERLGLVVVLGMGLFLVKLAWSAYAFTFPDELTHSANVSAILRTEHLFSRNSYVPVTAFYPGLAVVGAALSSIGGLTVFQAGILISAAARLLLMVSLFLAAETISRSARVASITTVLYVAHPNFLFYGAQFAYETLALPLAALTLLLVIRRADARTRVEWAGMTAAAIMTTLAVVVTHHVTSYALVAALIGTTAFMRLVRRPGRQAPLDLTVVAVVLAVAWTLLVAQPTLAYLGFVFGSAGVDTLNIFRSGSTGRQLFQSSTGLVAPLWERSVGILSQILIAAGLALGARHIWRARRNPYVVMLGATALLYPVMQTLRLTSGGWETANRSSEFLFFGVAFVVAVGMTHLRSPRQFSVILPPVLAGYVAVVLVGGVIVGWPLELRLARPWLLNAEGHRVQPQNVALSAWAAQFLKPGDVVAIDRSNALTLLAYAALAPETGESIRAMTATPTWDASVVETIKGAKATYVGVDERQISWDHLAGQFPPGGVGDRSGLARKFDPASYQKFDNQPAVSRIFDSGSLKLYDVRGIQ